ncbi:Pimeloyl-ACP methyl ester carboxylesterase [Lentzea albidocapillata subsp. violacea]|uniref:Pimeloyl-ACP methyl ester carboxylesterase n=1 Tax=Lentzea albidocapillata subsp. violacea TaxID=128104 RepID=A0A1G9GCB9_9PSEU|nr:Pimeloyl-ACP methyl ester carboxylesterase [Lentzea albidocapillata subsp. violacea]
MLLHGLGATGEVWQDVVEDWEGSWLVPDLPGHGRSNRLGRYSFGSLAAAVADAIPREPVTVVGHSLGGVVGLALASGWFGVEVTTCVGVGIKVRWTDEELQKAAALAAKPGKVFATEEEAVERASKMAGVRLEHGVSEVDGGWAPSLDMGAFGVGRPDMAGLIMAAQAHVVLAAGENDPMSPQEHLRELVPEPVMFPGAGHNVHVESPSSLRTVLAQLAT